MQMRRIFLKNRFIYRKNDVYFVKLIKFLNTERNSKPNGKIKRKAKKFPEIGKKTFLKTRDKEEFRKNCCAAKQFF